MNRAGELLSFPLLLFLALIGGVLSFEHNLRVPFIICIAICTLLILLYAYLFCRNALIPLCLGGAVLLLIHGYILEEGAAHYRESLDYFEDSKAVIGEIESFPIKKGEKYSFSLRVLGVRIGEGDDFLEVKSFLVLVQVKGEKGRHLRRGERVKIESRLKLPKENFFDFNYRRYLLHSKIYGILYIKEEKLTVIELKGPQSLFRRFMLERLWRQRRLFLEKLRGGLSARSYSFILSIFFGIRSEMESELYSAFQNSGLVHLLAISGLHIGFLGLMSFKIGRLFLSASKSYLLSLLFLFLYINLISPSASSYRAFLMFMAGALFFISGFKTGGLGRLAISGTVLLFINPYYIFNLGFQLSFIATAGILLYAERIKDLLPQFIPEKLRVLIGLTLSAFGSITPVQWAYFGKVPLFALVSSLVVVPLFSLLFSLLFFLLVFYALSGLEFITFLIEFLIELFLKGVHILNYVPPLELPGIPILNGYISLIIFVVVDIIFFALVKRVSGYIKTKRELSMIVPNRES